MILELYKEDKSILEKSIEIKQNKNNEFFIYGNSYDNVCINAIISTIKESHLLIANSREEAKEIFNDFKVINNNLDCVFLDSSISLQKKSNEIAKDKISDRLISIEKIQNNRNIIIISYPEALIEKVVTQKVFEHQYKLKQNLNIAKLVEELHKEDFERVPYVFEYGQFSIRGNIIDIYSYSNIHPYRIELFDTTIEEIRTFDIETQLSIQKKEGFSLTKNTFKQNSSELKSLFDILSDELFIWSKDLSKLNTKLNLFVVEYNEILRDNESFKISEEYFINKNHFSKVLQKYKTIDLVPLGQKELNNQKILNGHLNIETPININKNFNKLFQLLNDYSEMKYSVVIMSEDIKQFERFDSIFIDLGQKIDYIKINGELVNGFVDNNKKIAVFTTHQIFERNKNIEVSKRQKNTAQAIMLKALKELKPGDYVTHIDHGIGRFSGLEKLEVNNAFQETVRLVYANNDILYVHINSLYKINKYQGKDGLEPKLNKLGSDTWQSIKRKTKKKVIDIADELIKLYAKRKLSKGYSFSNDTYLQLELESTFEFEDTLDQAKATVEVKTDMEKEMPMDRLICGDVGFGKTEIAIRAAFKAVADSKQVAVLVPTTILAYQHYRTFTKRLKDLPCNIDYINRFRSTKEKTEILKKLSSGKIDILIGTHAIVNSKTLFKDLGLLIIDEEQKFGVSVKEKLKEMKNNVDTLTLTATPIPRTLQFSLLGARDYSLIQTPPPNRIPVYTEICVFEPEFIKEIITNEINRGGQVFFINNRIKELEQLKNTLSMIMPNIDMALAHGQMEGDKLEKTLLNFMEGNFDVLFSTNIIESGIDIPNANTIIINNAHQFGMSDLHQMRGRVGRSNKKAYCYLLCPGVSTLTNEAKLRLKAIEQNSDLGSGFQIAMRDLDLRGAGNLLGGEQSGFINDIGYDTFIKILEEAMSELKENQYAELYEVDIEKTKYSKNCTIETDFEMLIPQSYISNSQERFNAYTELNNLKTLEDLNIYFNNLKDIYGTPTKELAEISNSIKMKWIAEELGIERIIIKNGIMKCFLIQQKDSNYYQTNIFGNILNYISQNPKNCILKQNSNGIIIEIKQITSSIEALKKLEDIKK